MVRVLFWVLLVANIGLFWVLWGGTSLSGNGVAGQPPLNAEKIRVLDPAKVASELREAASADAKEPTTCLE
jgi:hypothetical protein